ncbi:MAG: LamG-like jellyroll fold domain-containing protein, partial [Candidatus Magasanikiibacteriota bacterium]
MKGLKSKILFSFLIAVFLIGGFLCVSNFALAQTDTLGLNSVGDNIALAGTDIRVIVVKIIRALLGLLGIIALVIVLYGGYVYMTSGGNEEEIGKAKKILINGVIGLIIIFSAFAIVQFVLNKLADATGLNDNNISKLCSDPNYAVLHHDQCYPDNWCQDLTDCCEKNSFVVKSITPNTDSTNMNNVLVRVVFSGRIQYNSGDVKIYKSGKDISTDFEFSVVGSSSKDENSVIEARYNGQEVCDEGGKCLPSGEYKVVVSPDIKDLSGRQITKDTACGTYFLEASFQVNTGEFAGYYHLDGTTSSLYITPNTVHPLLNDKVTVGVWVKVNGPAIDSWVDATSGKTVTSTAGWVISSEGFGVELMANLNASNTVNIAGGIMDAIDPIVSNGKGGYSSHPRTNTTVVTDKKVNEWFYVSMTYDGSIIKLYINGEFKKSVVQTGPIKQSKTRFSIGSLDNLRYNFNGDVDEVHVYNKVLTPQQITQNYSGGLGRLDHFSLVQDGIILNLHFDKTDDLTDYSTYKHVVKNNNAIWVNATTEPGVDKGIKKDITPPNLENIIIDGKVSSNGQLYRGRTYSFKTRLSDNSGAGLVRFSLDKIKSGDVLERNLNSYGGPRINRVGGSDAPPSNKYDYHYALYLPLVSTALQDYQVTLEGWDIDSNSTIVTTTFRVIGEHCDNEVQDGDETGVDVGGSCGPGRDGACKNDIDCAPNYKCVNNFCVPSPLITDVLPMRGAGGNWVTILGKNFGDSGKVYFGADTVGNAQYNGPWNWSEVSLVDCGGYDTWHNSWIIFEVPEGVINDLYNIKVERADNGLSDTTRDNIGPRPNEIGLFVKNDTKSPGLCQVGVDINDNDIPYGAVVATRNTPIFLVGKSFGDTTKSGRAVMFGGSYDALQGKLTGGLQALIQTNGWNDARINSFVPRNSQYGKQSVYVTVDGQASNGLPFTVVDKDGLSEHTPVIEEISPTSTTPGSLITIFGKNFGDMPGNIFVAKTKADALSCNVDSPQNKCIRLYNQNDTEFPEKCDNTWSDDQVVAKVPGGSWLDRPIVAPESGYQVTTSTNNRIFNINSLPADESVLKSALDFSSPFTLEIKFKLDKLPAYHQTIVDSSDWPYPHLRFDGVDDYVEAPGLDLTGKSFTVEFFAKRGAINSGDDFIIGQGISESYKGLQIGFRPNNKFTFSFWYSDVDTPAYTDLDWHHWAVTYDKDIHKKKIYRDGILILENINPNGYIYTAGSKLNIGGWVDDVYGNRWFKGGLDELRILDRVLSQQEISEDAAKINTGDSYVFRNNVLLWYHFDDSSELVVEDKSTYGNNGTLKNGVVRAGWGSGGSRGIYEGIVGRAGNYGFIFPFVDDKPVFCFALPTVGVENVEPICSIQTVRVGETYHYVITWDKDRGAIRLTDSGGHSETAFATGLDLSQDQFLIGKFVTDNSEATIEYSLNRLNILPGSALFDNDVTSLFNNNNRPGWSNLMTKSGIISTDLTGGEITPTNGLTAGKFYTVLRRYDGLSSLGDDNFDITDGPTKPGLCKLTPNSGLSPLPSGQYLTLNGEGLSSNVDPVVYFWQVGSVAGNYSTWLGSNRDLYNGAPVLHRTSTNEIETAIPVSSLGNSLSNPGDIKVVVNGQDTNSLRYQLSDCTQASEVEANVMSSSSYHCCSTPDSRDYGLWKNTVCDGDTVSAGYVWRFTNGRIITAPFVLERCDAVSIPSPSPSLINTEDARNACPNAIITTVFSRPMNSSTLVASNVKVYTCGSTEFGSIDCDTNKVDVTSNYAFVVEGESVLKLNPPASGHTTNTWHRVELSSNIESIEEIDEFDSQRLVGQKLKATRPLSRTNIAYHFDFRTGATNCKLVGANIEPNLYSVDYLGKLQDRRYLFDKSTNALYHPANPLYLFINGRADQECTNISAEGYPWQWNPRYPNYNSDTPPATIPTDVATATVQLAPSSGTSTPIYTNTRATAIGWHEGLGNLSVSTIVSSSVAGDSDKVITATSAISIILGPPRVTYYEPNCSEACINGSLRIGFSRQMKVDTYNDSNGIKMYKCANANCLSDQLTAVDSRYYEVDSDASTNWEMIVQMVSSSHYLEPDTNYKVVLNGYYNSGVYVSSTAIQGLTELSGIISDNTISLIPFQWQFKTEAGGVVCKVNRIETEPVNIYHNYIGQKSLVVANPYSSPNECSATGQLLNRWDYGYTWSSANGSIASVSNFNYKASWPDFCAMDCLPKGSDISSSTNNIGLSVCGNGTVDLGEDCDIARAGEVIGVSCSLSCLRPGNNVTTGTSGFVCGDGIVSSTLGEQCEPSVEGTDVCSSKCLLTGSKPQTNVVVSGASICGNNKLEKGEACDPEIGVSGCTNNCLHTGAQLASYWCDSDPASAFATSTICLNAPSVCGNNKIEKGEECEVNLDSTSYLRVLNQDNYNAVNGSSGLLVTSGTPAYYCSDSCLLKNLCGATFIPDSYGHKCNASSDYCNNDCTLAGSSPVYATSSFCGNGVVENGESNICEVTSTIADTVPGTNPTQMVTAIGSLMTSSSTQETDIRANLFQDSTILGSSNYYLMCGYNEFENPESDVYNNCPSNANNGYGVGTNSCCYARPLRKTGSEYPLDSAGLSGPGVCRNTYIAVEFDGYLDEKTVNKDTVFLATGINTNTSTYNCWSGSNNVTDKVISALDYVPNYLVLGDGSFINKSLAFIKNIFVKITRFFVELVYAYSPVVTDYDTWCSPNLVKDVQVSYRVDASSTTHSIITKLDIQLNAVLEAEKTYAVVLVGGKSGIKDKYGVGIKNQRTDSNALNDGWVFKTRADICTLSQVDVRPDNHLFTRPLTTTTFEIFGISQSANNQLLQPIANVYDWNWIWSPTTTQLFDIPVAGTSWDSNNIIIGSTELEGDLMAVGKAEIVSSTDAKEVGKVLADTFDLTANFCERPWPDFNDDGTWEPFKDTVYNFSLSYCADKGASGDTSDDLPFLTNSVFVTSSDPANLSFAASTGTLKRFFLFNDKNDDVIGIQIFSNEDGLDVDKWYKAQPFAGQKTLTTGRVANYPALVDENNYYVNVLNIDEATNITYSNIYLFSLNKGAQKNTRTVFEKLVLDSLKFNINLTDFGYCLRSSADLYVSPYNYIEKECDTDFDCRDSFGVPLTNANGTCSNVKTKIFRDLDRLNDIKEIQGIFDKFKAGSTMYPDLKGGTYIPGYTNSKWSSWGLLASKINSGLPSDPLNTWVGCDSNAEQGTCWNAVSSTFYCPHFASIYEYKVATSTNTFLFHVPLEYFKPWYGVSSHYVSPTGSYSFDRLCEPDFSYSPFGASCGDGVVNSNEECDPPGSMRVIASTTQGFVATSTCSDTCMWSDNNFYETKACGNDIVEIGEACDDGLLNGTYGHCAGVSSTPGHPELACKEIHPEYCGNNTKILYNDKNELLDYKSGAPLEFCETTPNSPTSTRMASLKLGNNLIFNGSCSSANQPTTQGTFFNHLLISINSALLSFNKNTSAIKPSIPIPPIQPEADLNLIPLACGNIKSDIFDCDNDGIVNSEDNCPKNRIASGSGRCSNNSTLSCDLPVDPDNLGVTEIPKMATQCQTNEYEIRLKNIFCKPVYVPSPDSDNDGKGDICDVCPSDKDNDKDQDGYCANLDNCPNDYNPESPQSDLDANGVGDVCDGGVNYILALLSDGMENNLKEQRDAICIADFVGYCNNSTYNYACRTDADCAKVNVNAFNIDSQDTYTVADFINLATTTGINLGKCVPKISSYNINKEYSCSWDCQNYGEYCGDNVVKNGKETCDDGNNTNGDGCSNKCQPEGVYCGDREINQVSEDCDGGTNCTPDCKLIISAEPLCGDGIKQTDNNEDCDEAEKNGIACTPGYGSSCSYCSADCKEVKYVDATRYCGNGVVDMISTSTSEICDYRKDSDGKTLVVGPYLPFICLDKGSYQCVEGCTRTTNDCYSCSITPDNNKSDVAKAVIDVFNVMAPNKNDQWRSDFNTNNIIRAELFYNHSLELNNNRIFWKQLLTGNRFDFNYTNSGGLTKYYVKTNNVCDQGPTTTYKIRFRDEYNQAWNNTLLGEVFDFPVSKPAIDSQGVNTVSNTYAIVPPVSSSNTFRAVIKWDGSVTGDFVANVFNSSSIFGQVARSSDAVTSTDLINDSHN